MTILTKWSIEYKRDREIRHLTVTQFRSLLYQLPGLLELLEVTGSLHMKEKIGEIKLTYGFNTIVW